MNENFPFNGSIDFPSKRRFKVHTSVINFLSTPGVNDELKGVVIRDSFADRLFPGMSTFQFQPKDSTLTSLPLKGCAESEKHTQRRSRTRERDLKDNQKWRPIRPVEVKQQAGFKELGIVDSTTPPTLNSGSAWATISPGFLEEQCRALDPTVAKVDKTRFEARENRS